MLSLNRVQLIGNVGADPEVRYVTPDRPVAKFSLATSSEWTGKDGEKKSETTWHPLVAFGALARTVEQYVTKGRLLYVEGQLQIHSYETPDGERRRHSIVLRELKLFPRLASVGADAAPTPESLPPDDHDLTPEFVREGLADEPTSPPTSPRKRTTKPAGKRQA